MMSRTTFSAASFAGLVLLALCPPAVAWIATTGVILILGVPHGALDGEIARPLLRPQFGRAWFVVFAVPYLALSAGVLMAWRLAPVATLATFLAASVWHFGDEDTPEGEILHALVRGGLPIAVPVLLHPAATSAIFAAALQMPAWVMPPWLTAVCLTWLGITVAWVAAELVRGDERAVWPVFGLCSLFIVLPPLTAFAIYFVAIHAPAHMNALIRHTKIAPRVRDMHSATRLSLPVTFLTFGLCAALWSVYRGPPEVRFLGLTLQVLAALTLPHMLLGLLAERHTSVTQQKTRSSFISLADPKVCRH